MCISAGEITDPLVRPGGASVWALRTNRPADAAAATTLVRWDLPAGGETEPWHGPEPLPGRGLSGGSCAWSPDGAHLAVVTVEGPWWARVGPDGSIEDAGPVPVSAGHSWSSPAWSPDSRSLALVADRASVRLWRIADVSTMDATTGSHDFVIDPTWWTGGVVVHAWSRPEMAWTSSSIAPGVHETPGCHVQQPRSSPDGTAIGYLVDESGVLNLRILRATGEILDIVDDCEAAGPTWGPGQRTWCWSPDSRRVAIARNVDGFGVLSVVDIATGRRVDLGRAVHGALSWQGNVLAALRTGARTPAQLVVHDVSDPFADAPRRVLAVADPRWDAPGAHRDEMTEPATIRVEGPGGMVPVRLHRSRRPSGRLLCWIHGGPTDQWQVTHMARLVFWLSRGFDIAVVDHRGSTGHGRDFMLALHGAWGRADAEDLCAAAEHLHGLGAHSPRSTAFLGGSAGGLTVLSAAASRPDLVAAVVTSYPVVDLALLAAGDDPFESHYVPTLVGESLGHIEPVLDNAARLADVPTLVFHGDSDPVVPLEHSERLVRAVRAHGGTVDLRVFVGEGHGFRRREHQLAEYALTAAHLEAHLA